jgi:hypothetical protein
MSASWPEDQSMKYRVRLYFDAVQNLYHASHVYAGLCALAARGEIELEWSASWLRRDRRLAPDEITLCMDVEQLETRSTRRIAIDLRDRSDDFSPEALDECDVYFKRSFHAPDHERLSPEHRGRIRPFGLNYACRNPESSRLVPRTFARQYALRGLRSPLKYARRFHADQQVMRQYLGSPDVADFEQPPEARVQPTVLFQTRVWTRDDLGPDDAREVNDGRAAVVRALRAAFGERFVGGLVPTDYAKRHYPDLLTTHASRRRDYVAMSKRNLIGIYTRGLHHSLAFKLSEFLAASQCIVSEPLRNELAPPLVEGTHFLEFGTADECVEQCRALLDDPERAHAMRRANYACYLSEVEPSAHLMRCLERSFAGERSPVAAVMQH